MKMIAEYLERSMRFHKLAEEASDPDLKAKLQGQAVAYYELAVKHAIRMGLRPPDRPAFLS